MNGSRTDGSNCAETEPERRTKSVRFEIVDAIGRRHGPYSNFKEAREYIQKRFSLQQQDDQRTGRYPTGWDISVANADCWNINALSLRRLREVLDYDPETGVLSWRLRLSPRCKIGQPAGVVKQGYRKISIDGKNYTASHLAWFHFYGVAPEGIVDHKDLDRDNNRIDNLREATHSQNSQNQGRNSQNSTGFKGVAVNNQKYTRAKYRSSIRINKKRIFLGLFHTPEEAYEAYCQAAAKYHGAFARVE
jgi:hypothetical protein